MPNRIIKESICTSENLNRLSVNAEVFFYRLMVNCDDYGRLPANLQILRSRLFPLKVDEILPEMVDSYLSELVHAELIYIYETDGKTLLQVQNWDRHQQKRAKHSKYPAYDSASMRLISCASNCNNVTEHDGICITPDIKCNHEQSYVPENRETRNENREEKNNVPPPGDDPPENDNPAKTSKIFGPASAEYKIADYLLSKILELDSKARRPNLQLWAMDIDKMIRIDKRAPAEVKDLIDFAHGDNFWRKNILSAGKLREKATALTAAMNGKKARGGTGYGSDAKYAAENSKPSKFADFDPSQHQFRSDG